MHWKCRVRENLSFLWRSAWILDSTVQGTHSLIRFSFLGIYFEFSLNRGYLEDTMGRAWKKRTMSFFFLFPFETENSSAPERRKWPRQMENTCWCSRGLDWRGGWTFTFSAHLFIVLIFIFTFHTKPMIRLHFILFLWTDVKLNESIFKKQYLRRSFMLITEPMAVIKLETVDHESLGITSPGVGTMVNF